MENIKHQLNDGGKAASMPQEKLDCVVRAWAIATDKPYSHAHDIVKAYGRKDGHRTNSQKTRELVSDTIGAINDVSLTVNQFIKQHSVGVYFCHIRGHVFTVKNGVIHDTGMIGKRCRITYFAQATKV